MGFAFGDIGLRVLCKRHIRCDAIDGEQESGAMDFSNVFDNWNFSLEEIDGTTRARIKRIGHNFFFFYFRFSISKSINRI